MSDYSSKESRFDQAIALREEGELVEAAKVLEKLVLDEPDYALAHLGLGVFYCKMNRFDDSLREASRACELASDNPFYYTALSSLAIKGGHRKAAEEALAKAQEARFAAFMKKYREENPELDDSETDGTDFDSASSSDGAGSDALNESTPADSE